MPELPEVETIKRTLKNNLIGKKIKNVEILEPKQFSGEINQVISQTIVDIVRKGKVLSLKLSNNLYLSIHLKLSGQILFSSDRNNAVYPNTIPRADTNKMPAATTRIIIDFDDNSALFFNDMRKFGWMKVLTDIESVSVDVLSPTFTQEYLSSVLTKTKKPIKTVLMDQTYIAGLGNIYANDSLWEAKINPLRKCNTLSDDEIGNLHNAIMKIIKEALSYKGSSAKDELYIIPDGSKGQYQNYFKVYHQHNKPCPRCGDIIVYVKQAGRSSFYCPTCQKM
ncbi:MAG TPA: bifunctional DNA-formamidopyrimidine glycosylase/DNA-(apurinic or apyrimidinic site) lyase [Candidatus Nitrosocosmicus sp.]|nr:bifunctional DNA-formamidopyrimidine glycosylase/DNA-(apurinic or apyrimidinic site) lyase [Candidatus Nitrosocosmicus sp.]